MNNCLVASELQRIKRNLRKHLIKVLGIQLKSGGTQLYFEMLGLNFTFAKIKDYWYLCSRKTIHCWDKNVGPHTSKATAFLLPSHPLPKGYNEWWKWWMEGLTCDFLIYLLWKHFKCQSFTILFTYYFLFTYFWFGATLGNAQSLLPTLHSGITSGSACVPCRMLGTELSLAVCKSSVLLFCTKPRVLAF